MTLTDLLTRETLGTVRTHARSASWHRTMANRTRRIGCPREAAKHDVSARLATARLQYAINDARNDDIEPAVVQVVVMEGEAAGVNDADAALDPDVTEWMAS